MEDLWTYLPVPALFKIFSHLKHSDLLQCGRVCKAWYEMSRDDFLWKRLFYSNYKVDSNVSIVPGRSWYNEFKRLCYNIPIVETEVLTEHYHQVLHVSFSHNGKYFATCSKDGSVLVWNSDYPASIKYHRDMTAFSWKYTQYSQFNESDTLLLVSGVHFGTPHSTSGEIAVFSLQGKFDLQCRVVNKPYDIFGTWYSDQHLLSGDLQWLAHLVSTSVLWLNKASQEAESEHVPITQSMYRFYNRNASSVRAVMVANCLPNSECVDGDDEDGFMLRDRLGKDYEEASQEERGNPPSHRDMDRGGIGAVVGMGAAGARGGMGDGAGCSYKAPDLNLRRPTDTTLDYASTICYSSEYRRVENESCGGHGGGYGCSGDGSFDRIDDNDDDDHDDAVEDDVDEVDVDDDVEDVEAELLSEVHNEECGPFDCVCENGMPSHRYKRSENGDSSSPAVSFDDSAYDDVDQVVHNDKYLIFTTGYKTYTPHQIGFKRIKPFMFPKRIDPGLSLKERLEMHERKKELMKSNLKPPEPDWLNYDSVADKFDKIDHLIDLHGHIIGMGLSPDHRYLYVNSRPWPQGYEITHPLDPPPIAQEIDIHVIDLVTLKEVGTMLRAHKAYTPNNECFFIFLDVCDQYVASGAEDKHGYLWDRHYGICLAKFPHADVVSSVAFNPKDPEMLVTTSDDNTIKVWRSRSKVDELGLKQSEFPKGIEVQKFKKPSAQSKPTTSKYLNHCL